MILKDLIARLEKEDPNRIVAIGFGDPHSYRGFYDKLAFKPTISVDVGYMLANVKGAVGVTFQGYKGGDYTMGLDTDVYLAQYGECGLEIDDALLDYLLGASVDTHDAIGRDTIAFSKASGAPRTKEEDEAIRKVIVATGSNPDGLIPLVEHMRIAKLMIEEYHKGPTTIAVPSTVVDDWAGLMTEADKVVRAKGRDYTKDSDDRLANFKNSGNDAGITPLQAWLVFMNKHHAAICTYVKTGGQSESEPIFTRFVDLLNYTRLGWLLVVEKQKNEKPADYVTLERHLHALAGGFDYTQGGGRYMFVEGGRKFEIKGRGATDVQIVYDDGGSPKGVIEWFHVSWLGEQIRKGLIVPIDGTPT